jgi:hypothetical protein
LKAGQANQSSLISRLVINRSYSYLGSYGNCFMVSKFTLGNFIIMVQWLHLTMFDLRVRLIPRLFDCLPKYFVPVVT